MFTFTALAPAPYIGTVHQSLLSFDNVNMLIDAGWDADLSLNLDYLTEIAPTIDVILLTHATVSHIGAYAYLAKFPEFASIPVFATLPVINMGRMVTLDMYRSVGKLGPFLDAEVTVQDVEAAFDKVESLKYSQPFNLSGRLDGITITAYNAGHTLGGTIWKIQKDHEDVVYAVDWNHSRDSHLNGAFMNQGTLIEALAKPSVLICGSGTGEGVAVAKRKQRLLENIKQVLGNGGSVLIPTSSGARVLEMIHLLDRAWLEEDIGYPLVYLSHVGKRTLNYASSMLEWMSSTIISEWETQNNSPFDTKRVKLISDMNELALIDGPKVVIATGEALEAGFAKLEFIKMCQNDQSMVVLTEKHTGKTLNSQLLEKWQDDQDGEEKSSVTLTTKLAVRYPIETPLEGEDLATYNARVKENKENTEKEQAMEMRNKNILEEPEDSEESDSDDEVELSLGLDLDVLLVKNNDIYDYDLRNSKGKPRMFPYSLKRKRVDDYGEVIKNEDFMRANEKQADVVDDPTQQQAQDMEETKIGAKRKWNEYDEETHKLDAMSVQAIPSRIETTGGEIKVLCKVDFIDFEGLADPRSMATVIDSVKPKKLIVIGHTEVKFEVGDADIVINNEAVNASINSFAFSVKVAPELESLLKWQRILGDYSVAHVLGKLKKEEENAEWQLVTSEFAAPRSNQLLVGDIKLAELKRKLIAQGHRAEYRAEGILVCDDKVAIRKLKEGKLEIEGGVDPEFYETKNVVRQLLASV